MAHPCRSWFAGCGRGARCCYTRFNLLADPSKRVEAAVCVANSGLWRINVLIIAGASSGSQDGAAEFATNEKLLGAFADKIEEEGGRLPFFDVLIRTTMIDGHAQGPAIVAYRSLKQ